MAQSVVVRLTTGDAEAPQFDESFPLTTAFEATPQFPSDLPEEFIPIIIKHVEEIIFYGGSEVDATLLLIPLYGFLPPGDERVVRTVKRIMCGELKWKSVTPVLNTLRNRGVISIYTTASGPRVFSIALRALSKRLRKT